MLLLGFGITLTVGFWVIPTLIVIQYDDARQAFSRIPRQYLVFPSIPEWFTKDEKIISVVGMLLSTVLSVSIMKRVMRYWRYLVVEKFRWNTDEEVDAFLKRDPGW